ncbi:L-type lectin-domain containing receptor kinase IV.1 [Andrographis paniculata]|uniref:L-type lectin-domain containing receptor kinase IV.1 n=1 Tax=Andrographis paniculata TaxID=175694 RepID=UPI0021E88281|nr:L-type lectin-domain containing receptor kinase IV.1 [Andrographis paniculata]
MSALIMLLPFLHFALAAADPSSSFIFNGFESANLSLSGLARVTSGGLLWLSNATRQQTGHAFNPTPFIFKNSSNGSAFSFSTYFVCAIVPASQLLGGHGMAFVIAPAPALPGALPSTYLGLFNESSNGNNSTHVIAVELDTLKSTEFRDIDDNHVGIDINSLVSVAATPAAYYDESGVVTNMTLNSSKPMQVWIEYDQSMAQLNVTIAPIHMVSKPSIPLLSLDRDLSPVLNQIMYVGFSGAPLLESHYVLGWSFSVNDTAAPLDISRLPKLPRIGPKKESMFMRVGLPVILAASILLGIFGLAYYIQRKRKFAEVIEAWELDYMTHRFRYKDLYVATKGFKDDGLLGAGGFGKVYHGVMPDSKIDVAVKKVSHESRQGMKEFVAEIVSIGRLRHRNLVPLLGYCRRKGELLLVYEYMPNGSLDKYLYAQPRSMLTWDQRFRVIKGVASGLLYLHEEWEQVVIHRDIKASNILLDSELEARLGDFGLARLYDHGSDPQTTHVVGTIGYLAPEHTRTGKATTSTDVYAFGAFLLEVACGRRPVEPNAIPEKTVLVEWVFNLWSRGDIVAAVDQNLGSNYAKGEAEMVLKLGLLCSHSRPEMRPGMREIVRFLDGTVALPELSSYGVSADGLPFVYFEGFDDVKVSYTSFGGNTTFSGSSSVTHSLLSSGR